MLIERIQSAGALLLTSAAFAVTLARPAAARMEVRQHLPPPGLCVLVSEPGNPASELPGVEVRLTDAKGVTSSMFTGAEGAACFSGDFAGQQIRLHALGGAFAND